MKKLFITAALATIFSASAFAADGGKTTVAAVNISYTALNQFHEDFTDAKNVSWTVNRNFQKAEFTVNDVKMTAFYNFLGQFVGVTQDIDYKAVPAKAQKEITDQYSGYKVKEVIVLQSNTEINPDADETAYFVDLKSETKEVLVKITPEAHIEFFKQVK